MRVLVTNPPMVPSYFNAGHHLALFQTAAALRGHPGVREVVVRDLSALNSTWASVCRLLTQTEFDVIAIFCDFDGVDGLPRLIEYALALSPTSRRVVFGRAAKHRPGLFHGLALDAIAFSGDYEAAICDYLDHLVGNGPPNGCHLLTDKGGGRRTSGSLSDA